MQTEGKHLTKVGISLGDINGIGIEVILKSLMDNRIYELCTVIIYGSNKTINYHRKALNISNLTFHRAISAKEANTKTGNIISAWSEEVNMNIGEATAEGGQYALKSIEAATADLVAGEIDVLVTAPINKDNIQSEEFNFPGHTEYLMAKDGAEDSLMFMVSDVARIGVVTGHIPLKEVAAKITTESILKKITLMNKSLMEDFGIVKPKLAVMGLNPHAGDNGLLGDEEEKIITPAITQAKNRGILAFGPFPADGFFGAGAFKNFDGILAMYHDQGLIPAKTLSFGGGINFTAGLKIIRTSPDHGTGYDIAGQDKADESSFRNAIYKAIEIHKNRARYEEMTADPLQISKGRN
ncbi:4-hydroxythreonine-4-phosphate dehydrogenase PdxA [Vicingaceae bacterium]|nr:4-hydroxythreonine-4-phosphate dehydrogenase PdxA [Vicingaceae bacterium]